MQVWSILLTFNVLTCIRGNLRIDNGRKTDWNSRKAAAAKLLNSQENRRINLRLKIKLFKVKVIRVFLGSWGRWQLAINWLSSNWSILGDLSSGGLGPGFPSKTSSTIIDFSSKPENLIVRKVASLFHHAMTFSPLAFFVASFHHRKPLFSSCEFFFCRFEFVKSCH